MKLINTKKIEPQKKINGIYSFVLENCHKIASEIFKTIGKTPLDKGGIFFIEGPVKSGKSLAAMDLNKLFRKEKNLRNRKFIFCQPLVDRTDVPRDKIFSRAGTTMKAFSFESKEAIEQIFHDYDVVVMDEVQFIPNELQSYVLQEIMLFVERGGWFVGLGLHYTSQKGEFIFPSLLISRAKKSFKMSALCQMCGSKTDKYDQRLINGVPATIEEPELLEPSAMVTYEPRCEQCLVVKK